MPMMVPRSLDGWATSSNTPAAVSVDAAAVTVVVVDAEGAAKKVFNVKLLTTEIAFRSIDDPNNKYFYPCQNIRQLTKFK